MAVTKKQLLIQILGLTERQSVELEKEDLGEFESLLNRKERLFAKMKRLGKDKAGEREEYLPILTELIALDEANNERYHEVYEELRARVKGVRVQQNAVKAYNNPYMSAPQGGILFDKTSK